MLRRIASNPLVDVDSVLFDHETWEPRVAGVNYLRPTSIVLDPTLVDDWARMVAFRPQAVHSVEGVTDDKTTMLLAYAGDKGPPTSRPAARRGLKRPLAAAQSGVLRVT